jgi:flagellar hook-associated protein 3 FlgL
MMKRISDLSFTNTYLNNLNVIKNQLSQLNMQISTGKKINKPSDSPTGTSQILRMNKQISQIDTFSDNIQNSLSFANETSFAMESIQSEVVNILTNLTSVQNAANTDLNSFADQVDLSLQSILNSANSEYDGKYLFSGTDQSAKPFGYSADGKSIEVKLNDISGTQKVRISSNILQKINMTGQDVFGTTITQSGSLDSGHSVGDVVSNQQTIYDAEGNQYTLNLDYTKTAANTYSLSYDVLDSSNSSIFSTPPASKTIVFDSATGVIQSVDGNSSFSFNVTDSTSKINFSVNLNELSEKNSSDSVSLSANQKNDIFNTLIQIRDNLKNGIKPTDEQVQIVKDFNANLVNNIAANGNVVKQLNDTSDLITNQQANIEALLSQKQDVDVAKAITNLQNMNYVLDMNYKLASMFLPHSLLDYL